MDQVSHERVMANASDMIRTSRCKGGRPERLEEGDSVGICMTNECRVMVERLEAAFLARLEGLGRMTT